jgi:uncharacterized membrane protein
VTRGATSGRTETGRVEAFSDGVFAIVITLLIVPFVFFMPSRVDLEGEP